MNLIELNYRNKNQNGDLNIIHINLSQKISYIKRIFSQIRGLISTYLSFILVIFFLIPWINGKLAIHDSSEVINLIEVFVLSSATLSLLTFTYIFAMTNLHRKIKNSMEIAGESFFMATIQFIVGLGLFLLVTLTINHFIDPSNITLSFSLDGTLSVFLLSIQLIGVYETASALSKFIKGIFEIYKSFRVKKFSTSPFHKFLENDKN